MPKYKALNIDQLGEKARKVAKDFVHSSYSGMIVAKGRVQLKTVDKVVDDNWFKDDYERSAVSVFDFEMIRPPDDIAKLHQRIEELERIKEIYESGYRALRLNPPPID